MNNQLLEKLKKIKVLALDCDGVLTPAYIETGVIMDFDSAKQYEGRPYESVVEVARFSHRDGQGIDLVRKPAIDLKVIIITGQRSGYVRARCHKMNVECIQTKDKVTSLNEWLGRNQGISMDEVCFVGDDTSDLGVMGVVGLAVCVADGIENAQKVAHYVTKKNGGEGAVREICDLIIAAKSQDFEQPEVKRLNVLITGTGEKATEEVRKVAKETARLLALKGHTIMTNGGPNGVPEAAALGVRDAQEQNPAAVSCAYTFIPGKTTEQTKTTILKAFPGRFEMRNAQTCEDLDVAVFFQGGLGTQAKFLTIFHRIMHINKDLVKNGFPGLQRQKLIIVHESFAPNNLEVCQKIFGSHFKEEHFSALRFASTADEIVGITTTWQDALSKNGR